MPNPFAEDRIYVRDWSNKRGHRMRWQIVPSGALTLDYATGRPGWKSTASGAYHIITSGEFKALSEFEIGFEKRPLGLPDAGVIKVGVNLTALRDSGSEALADLGYFIQFPDYNAVPLYLDAANSARRNVRTGTLWTLLSDRGDRTLGIEDFHVEFQGIQRGRSVNEYKVRHITERTLIEVEIMDITKFVLENVLASDVAALFRDVYGDDSAAYMNTTASTTEVGDRRFYNYLYRIPGANFGDCIQSSVDNTGDAKDIFRAYRLTKFWTIVARLCDNLYQAIVREAAYAVGGRKFAFKYSGDHTLVDATPWEHITFHKLDNTAANHRGSALAREDVYFIGLIWRSDAGISWSYVHAHDKFIGGFLCIHSEDGSLFNKETANIWDMLKRVTKSCLKVHTERAASDQINLWFCRMFDNFGGEHDITRRDFQVGGGADVTIVVGDMVINGCSVGVANTRGSDETGVTYRPAGTLAEEDESATLIFHTHPKVAEGSARFQMGGDDDYGNFNNDLDQPFVCSALGIGFDPLILCYMDAPASITSSHVVIRVHSNVGIDLGTGTTYYDGSYTALPGYTGSYDSGGQEPIPNDQFDVAWWYTINAAKVNEARYGGLAYSLAKRIYQVFSDRLQVFISESVRHSKFPAEILGEKLTLKDLSGATIGLDIFTGRASIDGRVELTTFHYHPGFPIVIKLNKDFHNGTAKADLLAIPQPTS